LTAGTMNDPKKWDFIYLWHGVWSIAGGYTINADLTQYNIRNSSYQNNWDALYLSAKGFDDIEKASTAPQQAITLGIAKIMKAYIFQNLVDLYGDVPYSEAFQGSANMKPKYDPQQTIYEDLIVKIDAGIAAMKNAPTDVIIPTPTQDVMYAGNVTKWIKFANTLKLRILLHQAGMTGRYDSYIKAKITAIQGGFIGAGEGAMVNPGYQHSATKANPTWMAFYTPGTPDSHTDGGFNYYNANEDILDYTWNNANFGDFRAFALYGYFGNYSMKGNYFGVGNQLPTASCSGIGTGDVGTPSTDNTFVVGHSYDMSAIILSDFESLFLQAEAAQRGWIGTAADASTYYYAAIKANFNYLGLNSNKWSTVFGVGPTSDYDNFVQQNAGDPNFDFSAATDKIKLIMTQKWVSLSGNTPVELWTDYRRTGFPNFLHFSTDPAKKNATPPVRLLYPQREISTNGDNVPTIGRSTPDLFSAKIFWQNR
ncbi:MAG: SusD/RagB family nutrient-binding outer membrane lipoprotein, partial [Bacteroidota bacterium]|nr:SusD/RagB family nutrient-binding outer membrane lipoprotein [Bacteroidota bacterium]